MLCAARVSLIDRPAILPLGWIQKSVMWLERLQFEHATFAPSLLFLWAGTLVRLAPASCRSSFVVYRRCESLVLRSWIRALLENLGVSTMDSIVGQRCGKSSPRAFTIKSAKSMSGVRVPIFTIHSKMSSTSKAHSANGQLSRISNAFFNKAACS